MWDVERGIESPKHLVAVLFVAAIPLAPASSDLVCLLTEAETARFLSVSPDTLRKWRVRGAGPPYVRLETRLIRYQLPQLRAWLEAEERACCTTGVDRGQEAQARGDRA